MAEGKQDFFFLIIKLDIVIVYKCYIYFYIVSFVQFWFFGLKFFGYLYHSIYSS